MSKVAKRKWQLQEIEEKVVNADYHLRDALTLLSTVRKHLAMLDPEERREPNKYVGETISGRLLGRDFVFGSYPIVSPTKRKGMAHKVGRRHMLDRGRP